MRYKGVEITRLKSGCYMIKNKQGKTRIFETKEYLKNYIDNEDDLEFRARFLAKHPDWLKGVKRKWVNIMK